MNASSPVNVLLAGRDPASVRSVEALLTGVPGIRVVLRLLPAGSAHPLEGVKPLPSVLVLCCNDEHLQDLRALAALSASERPPVIICGTLRSPESARLAVRCGASDLLPAVPARAELIEAINRAVLQSEEAPAGSRSSGSLVTVIGAAGGVGASFVASNLAHLAIQRDQRQAILLDLDLQFAPLTVHLGIKPELGLAEALDRVETLDKVALGGYIARHRSGLALMAGAPEAMADPHAASAEHFRHLLQFLGGQFDRIVVDASRTLDPLSTIAVLDSEHIVMVLEQSIGNVHNATRLFNLLTRSLGVQRNRIIPVINRFSRRAPISPADIERTVGCGEVVLLGSEYELARESLDSATPLVESDRRSALSRALGEVDARIVGTPESSSASGFFRRALPLFRRGES